jgi:hypothetical protein
MQDWRPQHIKTKRIIAIGHHGMNRMAAFCDKDNGKLGPVLSVNLQLKLFIYLIYIPSDHFLLSV